jgi:GntR family transcriptional regulator of vanillate catabolism
VIGGERKRRALNDPVEDVLPGAERHEGQRQVRNVARLRVVVREPAERGVEPTALARIRRTLEELDDCFGKTFDDVDLDGYTELNARFHDQLAALAGSELLLREIERVNRLPFASPSAFLPDKAYVSTFRRSLAPQQEQHWAIVEAIEAREGARAESLAREHARAARINLEYAISEQRGLIGKLPGLALVKN